MQQGAGRNTLENDHETTQRAVWPLTKSDSLGQVEKSIGKGAEASSESLAGWTKPRRADATMARG